MRRRHKECQDKFDSGTERILDTARRGMKPSTDFKTIEKELRSIAKSSFIDETYLKTLLIKVWGDSVLEMLDDDVLSEDEEQALTLFKEHFSLKQDDLDESGAYSMVIKASVIRKILEGKIPERIQIQGSMPFNLQKDEKLVWLFQNVQFYEERTRTKYVGGYQGVSIRVAKGFYYRVGGFRGAPVKTAETIHIDTGLLGVTNKHIYFAGAVKAFKIRYDKIVSFMPYQDGIGIQRDAMTAKPHLFITGDGWFTYNLLFNLSQRQGTNQ